MSPKDLKFVFFGTPTVASRTLEILKGKGYIPQLIVTSPAKKSGRGLVLTETPVSIWAKANNIECLTPEKIDEIFINKILNLNLNLSIVVAYGKILPETLIKAPKLGTVNIHYSLLPKWRGASPLEATLLSGDEVTGVSIQQMEYKLDSGPILIEAELGISIEETKEELKEYLIKLGANCLCDILPLFEKGKIKPKIQNENDATFCKKIKREDGEIDLNADPKNNWNKYRAFYGWPGIFFFAIKKENKLRIKITKASYENNSFVIKRVIPEGKKEMSYEEFLKWN